MAAVVDGLGVAVLVALGFRALVAVAGLKPSLQGVIDALHEDPIVVAPLMLSVPLGFFAWHLLSLVWTATPGQRLMRLILVDGAGQRPSRRRLVVRAAGHALFGALCLAGPAWALLVDARRRGLGDVVAGTCAVVAPQDRGGRS